MATDWKDWKEFIDHCAGSTGKWRRVFKAIEGDPRTMTKLLLESAPIGQGYTAWDLAEDLESCIINHVSDTIYYERRHRWTTGEEGNGFALRKAMLLEHEGDHVLIKMGGRRLFNNWGRCTMKDGIEQQTMGLEREPLQARHRPDQQ